MADVTSMDTVTENSRLHSQSWDCMSTICKHRLRGWERLSWLTEQSWELSEMVNFPEVPGVGGLSTCPTLMAATELQELLTYIPYLYTQWKPERQPGFSTEIARSQDCVITCTPKCAISRLARSFQILRMHSTISRLHKFLDCMEHIATCVHIHGWLWVVHSSI